MRTALILGRISKAEFAEAPVVAGTLWLYRHLLGRRWPNRAVERI